MYPTYVSKHNSNRENTFSFNDFKQKNGTKNKLELYKRVCENKDFCNVVMSSEDTKKLEFNQYQKSDQAPFIIYTDHE